MSVSKIEAVYALARDRYAEVGVDTDAALGRLAGLPCRSTAGKVTTSAASRTPGRARRRPRRHWDYPGKARTRDELRQHATGVRVDPGPPPLQPPRHLRRDARRAGWARPLEPRHFGRWIDWAKHLGIGLDFNPTCFGHPLAADGFTLSHPDPGVRRFWVDHCRACRRIAAAMGAALGSPSVTNVWIPDGYKDSP